PEPRPKKDVEAVQPRPTSLGLPASEANSIEIPRLRMNTVCAIAVTPSPRGVPAVERWLFTIEKGPKPPASSASPEATRTTLCSTRSAGTPCTYEGAVYSAATRFSLLYKDAGFVKEAERQPRPRCRRESRLRRLAPE